MSPFLKRKFDPAKCKTLLQLTIQRIKVLRNKNSISIKKLRGEIAKLLESDQDSYNSTTVMVEPLLREVNTKCAYDLIEHYCRTTIDQLATIKSHKECPIDSKEAIASLIYAAEHCTELQELQKVQKIFMSKYGSEFLLVAKDFGPDCRVNPQIIERLSVQPARPEIKLRLLKEVAEEYKLKWNYENNTENTSKLENEPHHFSSEVQSVSAVDKIDDQNVFPPLDIYKPERKYTSTVTSDTINRENFAAMNDETKTNLDQDIEESVSDDINPNKRNLEAPLKPESDVLMKSECQAIGIRTREWKKRGKANLEFVDAEMAARVAFLSASEAAEAAKTALIMIKTRTKERNYRKEEEQRLQAVITMENEIRQEENMNFISSRVANAGLPNAKDGKEIKEDSPEGINLEDSHSLENTEHRNKHGEHLERGIFNEEEDQGDVVARAQFDGEMSHYFDKHEDFSEMPQYDDDHEDGSNLDRLDIYEEDPVVAKFDELGDENGSKLTKIDQPKDDPQFDKHEDESEMLKFDQPKDAPQFDKHEDESEMLPKFDKHEDDQKGSRYDHHDNDLEMPKFGKHDNVSKWPQLDEYNIISDDLPFDTEKEAKEAARKLSYVENQQDNHMPNTKTMDIYTCEPRTSAPHAFSQIDDDGDDDDDDSLLSQSSPVSDTIANYMIGGVDRYPKPYRKLRWHSKNIDARDSSENYGYNSTSTLSSSLGANLKPLRLSRSPDEVKENPLSPDLRKLGHKTKSWASEDSHSDSISPSFCSNRGYRVTTKTLETQVSLPKPRQGVSVRSSRPKQCCDAHFPNSPVYDPSLGK